MNRSVKINIPGIIIHVAIDNNNRQDRNGPPVKVKTAVNG